MTVRIVIREPVAERTTQFLDAVIRDENGVAIPGSALTELMLTLYATDAQLTILNNREKQDILNANGGTVDESGNLSLELTPDDTAIVDDTIEVEEHVHLFEFSYDGGSKFGKQEIVLKIDNLEKVPASATP